MENQIRDASFYANEKIQNIKTAYPFVLPIVVVFLVSAGLFAVFRIVSLDGIFLIIPPCVFVAGAIIIFIARNLKKKQVDRFINKCFDAVSGKDSDTFCALLDSIPKGWIKNKSLIRNIFLKIYSFIIPVIADDLFIEAVERRIVKEIRTRMASFGVDKIIDEIHRFYLDEYMKVFHLSIFAAGCDGTAPYPEKEEAFIKNFIEVFEVDGVTTRIYIRLMDEKIVAQTLEFIAQENYAALEWFINEREKMWGNMESFMREMLFSIYSSMIPIIGEDIHFSDEEKKIVAFIEKKIKKYTRDEKNLKEVGIGYFKNCVSSLLAKDEISETEIRFLKTMADIFKIPESETKGRIEKIRRYRELGKIEKGDIQKITPSNKSIHETDNCYYECDVSFLEARKAIALDTNPDGDFLSNFVETQQGRLFVTQSMIQIVFNYLHVIPLKDIVKTDLNLSSDILELKLKGELGDIYLKTPDNEKLLVLITYLLKIQ